MKTQDLLQLCRAKGTILATVESCTGGLVAAQITDIPGASEIYWGGWNTYDNTAKISLGVSEQLLEKNGAVSAEVAQAMAEAALQKATDSLKNISKKTLLAIATTGVAGPAGGSAEKPVGLCFLGVARTGHKPTAIRFVAPSGLSRAENRKLFTTRAIQAIQEALSS